MAKVSYINTARDGLCVWNEAAQDFVPLKQLEKYYEKVANEMGTSLFVDENDGE